MPAEPQAARLTIFADGASRGNPGPAAIGVVLVDEAGKERRRIGRRIGVTTNNEAEYRALIAGLEAAQGLGARSVAVRMDSELVVRQIMGRYKVRSESLYPLYQRALRLLNGFESQTIVHVPRGQNRAADALANAALDGRPGAD